MPILTITLEDQKHTTRAATAGWIATHLAQVAREIGSAGGLNGGTHEIRDVDRKIVGTYTYAPSAKHPG